MGSSEKSLREIFSKGEMKTVKNEGDLDVDFNSLDKVDKIIINTMHINNASVPQIARKLQIYSAVVHAYINKKKYTSEMQKRKEEERKKKEERRKQKKQEMQKRKE